MKPSQHKEKIVTAKKVAVATLLIDLGDVVMIGAISFITGSALLFAQVLQTIANIISDIFLLIGLHSAHKHSDKKHPFGYGRELYIWTLFAAVIMFGFTAGFSMYAGYQRLLSPEPIVNIWIALVVLIISLIFNIYGVKLAVSRMNGELRMKGFGNIWKKYSRSNYVETKAAFITDLTGSLGAIISFVGLGIFLVTGALWLDGLGAILIGIVMAIFSFSLIVNIKELLVGRAVSPEVDNQIRLAAERVSGVRFIGEMTSENVGLNRLVVDLDISLDQYISVAHAQEIVEKVKDSVIDEVPAVFYMQVELIPPTDDNINIEE
ncbi:MAG: cation diffusion facilitator family transporter [Flavobacteriaceae bacterium]|jgi:cation diffusion facilitator family transporter